MLTPEKIAELRALAEKIHGGWWPNDSGTVIDFNDWPDDIALIAALDPATVLALCDDVAEGR